MEITLKLTKDFERCLEDLKKEFGEDYEVFDGENLFLENYIEGETQL